MKTPFLKRQSTWICILLVGLVGIAAFLFFSTDKFKVEDYLPYLKADKTATDYNLGFEKVYNTAQLPDGWFKWGHPIYDVKVDSVIKHSGKYALRIEPRGQIIGPARSMEFSCPTLAIPARYAGKNVTVKAFMRTEDVDQPIGLMLRIDGKPDRVLQFDNMQHRGITGSGNWEEYSVTLPLPQRAETIYIGAILSGKGKLWIDDFQVLIDDTDIQFAQLKPENMYKADTDTEFTNGSKIKIKEYTPETVINLELLGRIWGFLKYYHPAVAAGEYNWDAELFRVMPSIISAKSIDERNEIFVQWIDRLGKVKRDRNRDKETTEVKMLPDLAWIENPELGKALSKRLEMVKNAKRNPENYYVSFVSDSKYPSFLSEREYENMSYYDDSGMRLLCLFRCWNMVQYFYSYRYSIEKEWNAALGEFIPRFLDGYLKQDYQQAIFDLMNKLNDPWTDIQNSQMLYNGPFGQGYLALYEIAMVDGQPVVKGYPDKDKLQSSELKIGDIILDVNNQPVKELKNCTFQILNPSFVVTGGIAVLHTPSQKLTVRVVRDGKPLACEINCFTMDKYTLNLYGSIPKTLHRFLSSDIGYIRPGTTEIDSLPDILKSFRNTKGLVIDLRHDLRSSDSIASALGAYLASHPVDFAKLTRVDITQPGRFTFMPLKVGKENTDYYKGKVVVLVNEATTHNTALIVMAVQVTPHAMVVGSATSGTIGDAAWGILPGDINTEFTSVGIYYPDGREIRNGIALDLEVKPTIRGIIEGRDELLEKAIEIINSKE